MLAAEPRKSRTGLYIFVACLAGVLLLCGGPLTWWFGRQSIAHRRLEEKKAELVAREMPIGDASLEVYRERLMSKDKSEQWVQILETLESDPFTQSTTGLPILGVPEDEQPFVPGQPWAHAEDVAKFLQQWSELREDLHDVTEKTEAIWTHTEFDSFATLLPYIQTSRSASRLLTLEHIDAVRRNDSDQAYHSLLALIGVSRSMEKEPLVISQLVHVATLSVALRQLKISLELDQLSDQQLLAILEQLQQIPKAGDRYRLAVAGERAMALPVFDDPSGVGEELPRAAMGSRSIDALASLEIYEQMENIETDSLDTFYDQTQKLDERISQSFDEAGPLRRFDTILTGLTTPAMGAVGKAFIRSEMETRIAKTAIGLRLYEHQHNAWPQALDELSTLDVDLGSLQPLGGKPFGFRVADGDALLWGFDMHSDATQVPDEPIDLEALDESQREASEYWLWRLKQAD
ncbi:hypothetical protein [Roseimaritima ulvae]|uniref:Uncharacterized protein n=1 Tax=Roseimaritima ulvae TaxID=980254 RepID=A0A5B9QM41_9BACT|nr:hypothetical protein [Roseimaritima ulvae]QEG38892.1 hypothetical protein UC8_08500 [Roseimaritima ulvae]